MKFKFCTLSRAIEKAPKRLGDVFSQGTFLKVQHLLSPLKGIETFYKISSGEAAIPGFVKAEGLGIS